ncbi:histidine phosphatase family protein [Sporosarcina limicola]|uniref:Phosphoglycerate mutase n=1 Tax=Sporosarcina limicola TaxID=34101 RepID=A0A927MKB1_9BACL|nr:histidine phosphatase family protein [Sporosarcina limicola]MBE1555441.1 putative phosphoglycerate mutase [Sporosarcina limicola]
MTTIGFVRHGITAWNKEGRAQGHSDIPLDEEGIAMAERIAERLSDEQWDIIYTSPLIRASKTAEIIAERKPGIDLVGDNRLREFCGGLIEGTTESERVGKWGFAWRNLDLGFEPDDEILSRGINFIEEVKKTHPGKRILVVSHGGFIGRLIGSLVPKGDLTWDLGNTSLTIIELRDKENLCRLFNCTEHLQ